MSTTPSNEKSDKTVPFTTSDDVAKTANGSAASSTAAVDMVNRAADKAHATIDRLATAAAPRAQQLQKSLEDTNELLHDRAERLRMTGNEWCDSLRSNVREHPLMAVGTALAVGLLIARLTR